MFGRLSVSLALMCVTAAAADGYDDPATTLARILAEKGSISKAELSIVESAAENARVSALAAILRGKGLLNDAEVAQVWTRRDGFADGAVQVVPVSAQAARAPAVTQPPQQRRTADVPVTSQTHVPVVLYGTVLFNAFYNTAPNNIQDVPLFLSKQGSDPTGGDKNFGMTARQTRLGLRFNEPNVVGAKLSSQFEFDLFGGKADFTNGMNMDLFRLRLAYGRLDWEHWAFEAGQDWAVFAPLNPTSYAMYAIPEFSASGNLWIRQPQLRVEYTSAPGDRSHFLWQLAANDPNVGDYPNVFSASRQPGIGERGRMPMMENRFAWTSKVHDRDFTVGVSGVYGRGKNAGLIGSIEVQQPVDSWGVALDYSLPFTRHFNLTGEAFVGRALAIFSGTAGEGVGAVGTAGGHGVRSQGGWMQAQYNFTRKWQMNLAYGIETPTASELPVGNHWRNQNYMGNLMYRLSNNLTFAWEYRRMLTDYRNQTFFNERGDHVNLAVAFMF